MVKPHQGNIGWIFHFFLCHPNYWEQGWEPPLCDRLVLCSSPGTATWEPLACIKWDSAKNSWSVSKGDAWKWQRMLNVAESPGVSQHLLWFSLPVLFLGTVSGAADHMCHDCWLHLQSEPSLCYIHRQKGGSCWRSLICQHLGLSEGGSHCCMSNGKLVEKNVDS